MYQEVAKEEEQPRSATRAKTNARNIFAVDRDCWHRACDVELNAAVAYLVLARGTGGDNRTTSWSAKAIEQHTGIGRDRAPKAIAALKDAGLIVQTKQGCHPRYTISPSHAVPGCEIHQEQSGERDTASFRPNWLWLPNRLVTKWEGVDDFSLLERVRRTQNLAALRLLVNLHGEQEWTRDGGFNWREGGMRHPYQRERILKTGGWTVWGFRPSKNIIVEPSGFPGRHGDGFEAALSVLIELEAVAFVPHLVEASGWDAEIIHSLGDKNDLGVAFDEGMVLDGIDELIRLLVPVERIEAARLAGFTRLVPVKPAFDAVQVVGIARLTDTADARLSYEWFANNKEDWSSHAFMYRDARSATSRQ